MYLIDDHHHAFSACFYVLPNKFWGDNSISVIHCVITNDLYNLSINFNCSKTTILLIKQFKHVVLLSFFYFITPLLSLAWQYLNRSQAIICLSPLQLNTIKVSIKRQQIHLTFNLDIY